MVNTRINYTSRPLENGLSKVVSIPTTLYKSLHGRYFLGQTGIINLAGKNNGWGALINPVDSGVNLHISTLTITNLAQRPLLAQIWFNPTPPGKGLVSNKVTCANTSITPLPQPKAKILYNSGVLSFPSGGVNTFNRLIQPNSTLVIEKDGQYIFPPGGDFLVYLIAPGNGSTLAEVAFGWWEEKVLV